MFERFILKFYYFSKNWSILYRVLWSFGCALCYLWMGIQPNFGPPYSKMDIGWISYRIKSRFVKLLHFLLQISLTKFIFKGLGFRPLPPVDNVESTLIWYKGTHHENYRQWTDALDKFLDGWYLNNTPFWQFLYLKEISFMKSICQPPIHKVHTYIHIKQVVVGPF